MGTKNKASLLLDKAIQDEIRRESERQDRSASWVLQQAWKLARERIKATPATHK